jgi:hypothetical protein
MGNNAVMTETRCERPIRIEFGSRCRERGT